MGRGGARPGAVVDLFVGAAARFWIRDRCMDAGDDDDGGRRRKNSHSDKNSSYKPLQHIHVFSRCCHD